MASSGSQIFVNVEEVAAFVERCLTKVGTAQDHAQVLAQLLSTADHRGHFSHGLNRLEMYIRDIQSGTTAKSGQPVVLKETSATALVDGKNVLGPAIGKFCIDLAISKAKESGIGIVVAKSSNHFGIAGWYSMRAMEQGLIGMVCTNTSPIVFPTRSKEAAVGTNALSFSAPGKEKDSFVLDMATSAVALGKVEVQKVKNESIPNGWGVDESGKETNSPSDVFNGGGLMPLGGSEINSGYKGYGLGVAIEVLCGILAGSAYGPFVRHWKTSQSEANLGQCFIAINPSQFAEGFEDRMQTLMDYFRNMEPINSSEPVMVAGDPERSHIKKCDIQGGIPYHPNMIEWMGRIANNIGVEPLKTCN